MDTRVIERMLFGCPEIDPCDYERFPLVDEQEFMWMASDFSEDLSVVHIYPFVRIEDGRESFIDIYFWDCMKYPEYYTRYVICDGYRLCEDDERSFLLCANEKHAVVDEKLFDGLCKAVINSFPQWHYIRYDSCRQAVALEHLYFASHRSGAREILFKAGLINFAHWVDELPQYNLVGRSPGSILETRAPMKLLRTLDQDEFFILHQAYNTETVFSRLT